MTQRIASMLASATEIVAALGLEDRLVAISHECDHPAHVLDRPRASRPRFDPDGLDSAGIDSAVRQAMADHGSVYAIDEQLLRRVSPDLILAQDVCEVCAVPAAGLRDALSASGIGGRVLSLDAHTIGDILASIVQIGEATGVAARARRYAASLQDRLDRVRAAVATAAPPRVLALEWLEPPFTPGHWVPEMVEAAGAHNTAGTAGAPSGQVAWDALAGIDPDVLLVMPCGYGLPASLEDADRHAAGLTTVGRRAIHMGRAFVLDGSSYFNRSGPRVFDGIEILAGLFHPDRWPAPSAAAAVRWSPAGT